MKRETEARPETSARDRGPIWLKGILAKPLQVGLDIVVLVLAMGLAYVLRFDFNLARIDWHRVVLQIPLVVGLQLSAYALWGVYSFIWRYVGLAELRAFIGGAVSSAVPLLLLRLGLPDSFAEWRVPASVIVVSAVLGLAGTLGLRVARRTLYERFERLENQMAEPSDEGALRTLLAGAGRAGLLAAREILGRGDMNLDILGFVDDDPKKVGSVIQGIRVIGTTADISALVAKHEIRQVIITIARASRRDIRRIVQICEGCGVRVRIIPGLYEVLGGRVKVSQIRDVDIADLLGREPVNLDLGGLRQLVGGKTVVVTGAGGSIGSELVRQVARLSPLRVVLLERSEFALYQIEEEIRRMRPDLTLVPAMADVGDGRRIRDLFRRYRPDVIIHAAAHKHVPLMEANSGEAVKNNVFGTLTVAEIAGEFGAETFIMISTDKAVNPTSIMGTTKRVAELVIQMLARRFPTRYVAVRFGNVLGSTGSVIPRFREQIARGGPVTVTHPEMRRYFMTIPEAAQLVLQAGAIGKGGEIFILDMGEPVKIVDLAADMIRLSGFKPHEDVEIVFTGVRPGEKLFEELGTTDDRVDRTRHEKVFVGRIPETPPERVAIALSRLLDLSRDGDEGALRRELLALVPEARLEGIEEPKPSTKKARTEVGETRTNVVPLHARFEDSRG